VWLRIIYGAYRVSQGVISEPIQGVIRYLAWINGVLAVFNIVPAFPLDGGRMLRSLLWEWNNNLQTATRISSKIGTAFSVALIIFGVLNIFHKNFVGGMWWVLIGMFLHTAARMSYQQLMVRNALGGEAIDRFMKSDPVTVDSSISIERLVDEFVYRSHYKMFPLVDKDNLLGCVTTQQIKEVPRENWAQTRVGDIAAPCSEDNTISAETDAVEVLKIMQRKGLCRSFKSVNNRSRCLREKRTGDSVVLTADVKTVSLRFKSTYGCPQQRCLFV
jgi:CBS domain-containing protein